MDFVSICIYFDITFAISVFIISIISGEQFTLSEIRRILSLSFAISLDFFREKGYYVVCLDARSKAGMKDVTNVVMEACKEKIERDRKRGIKNRPVRAMVVGIPNVGKSTFISVVSAAKPKIANYHFTTITPVLGVVTVGEKSFVMADIPGLIEGASEGIGLGHSFLRHVERCRLIVHVVDVSGIEGRDPEDDFEKINYELKNFSEEISERPQIVVMNKCDLASEEQIAKFRKYIEDKGLPCFECSAATTKGTAQVIEYIAGELDRLPPPIRFEAQPLTARELDEQELKKKEFTITKQDGIYIVDAPFMVPVLSMVNMEDYESLQYFQRVLRFSGIIDKLEEMGVQEDDTVSIYDFEFRYLR